VIERYSEMLHRHNKAWHSFIEAKRQHDAKPCEDNRINLQNAAWQIRHESMLLSKLMEEVYKPVSSL
jgi:hypothetical protein